MTWEMKVLCLPGCECPTILRIDLFGDLANLPSLKNNKLPGTNFLNGKTLTYLKLFTQAFYAQIHNLNYTFKDKPVFMLVSCAPRKRHFDLDNCFASACDLLEPSSKMVGMKRARPRGWGIGAVENDNQVTGLAVKAQDFGLNFDRTSIFIKSTMSVRKPLIELINEFLP